MNINENFYVDPETYELSPYTVDQFCDIKDVYASTAGIFNDIS